MTADRAADAGPDPSPDDRGRIPTPRPEVLVRVLDGLRDLPTAPRSPAREVHGGSVEADDARATGVPETLLPLPRRRS